MWYEGKGVISIGCQGGGPKDNGIGKIKVDLWRLLCEHCVSTYCSEVDHYALALRVGGSITDYDEEKIWKVRRSKKDRYIGADIDIPMLVWSSRTTDELKYYLSEKVIEAIVILVNRLKKDKVDVDKEGLLNEVKNAILKFNENSYSNMA